MMTKGLLSALCLALLAVGTPGRPAMASHVQIDIVHHNGPREPPPELRQEQYSPRRGYIWDAGHHEWRHGRYNWRGGHYRRERRGYDWEGGRWDRHDDHYDWHRGQWRPHR
jgi:hypothetical protein